MDYHHDSLQSDLEDTKRTVAGLEETKTKVMDDYRKERERYTNLLHFVSKYLFFSPVSATNLNLIGL